MRSTIGALLGLATCVAGQLACSASGATAHEDGAAVDSGSGSDGARPPYTLTPADTIFELTPDYLQVLVTNVQGACAYTQASQVKAGASAIRMFILGRSIVPGTYTVNSLSSAMPLTQVSFLATDAACMPLSALIPYARDGSTVVVDSIATDAVDGSYDLDFGARGRLAGN